MTLEDIGVINFLHTFVRENETVLEDIVGGVDIDVTD